MQSTVDSEFVGFLSGIIPCRHRSQISIVGVQSVIRWKPCLSIGIEAVDLQHRYLIDLINRLDDELLEPKDKIYSAKLVDELIQFVRMHFEGEENLMYKFGYPGLAEHKKVHIGLLDKLNGQIGMYSVGLMEGPEIVAYLSCWFAKHLGREDKEFGDFVRGTEAANTTISNSEDPR